MADRKGKARAWSVVEARGALVRDILKADAITDGAPDDILDDAIRERHLSKAYLAGIKAAREIATGMHWVAIGELVISEQVRLGMSPQAKRKGKSGEGRDNA